MAFGFFDASDPNVNAQLRQRIALAMLANKRKYPTTIGEGLGAIGEAIGDIGTERRLLALDKAQQEQARQAMGVPSAPSEPSAPATPTPSTRSSYAPDTTDTKVYGENEPSPLRADVNAEPGAPAAISTAGDTPANFANVRYNNPGAQYPGQDATQFGSTGTGVIGGGHQIAQFPTPVHGAAANFSLLNRGYTGMPIGQAISKWSGGGRSTVPGYDPSTVITKDMVQNPNFAIPFMQAVAKGEAPGNYPMTPEQWQTAHQWFRQGGAARDSIAAATTQQPTRLAFAGAPSDNADTMNFLPAPASAAPAAAAPARPLPPSPAPSLQIAQAPAPPIAQAPQPGYVPPQQAFPQAPPQIPPSRQEMDLTFRAQNNPYFAPMLQQVQQDRLTRQKQLDEEYKARLQQYGPQELERIRLQSTQQERTGKAQQAAREQAQYAQFGGMDPKEVEKQAYKTKEDALAARQSLFAVRDAQNDIARGAIAGASAEGRLAYQKFLNLWGLSSQGDKVVNTEAFKSAAANLIGPIRRILLSGSTSDPDREFLVNAIGGNINLEPASIQRIMAGVQRISQETLQNHNNFVGTFWPEGSKGHQSLAVATPDLPPRVPPADHVKILEESQKNGDPAKAAETAAYFNRTYGPGAAEALITRLKREGRLK